MSTFELATFAAGCFWGVEEYFRSVPGVSRTIVGYMGGHTENPTYELVKKGITGHAESCQCQYDPAVVSYKDLVKHFFKMHNPTEVNRQGPDYGTQYRSEIFTHSKEQHEIANEVKENFQHSSGMPVATRVTKASHFWPAEEYHQLYFAKNPVSAWEPRCHGSCSRAQRL